MNIARLKALREKTGMTQTDFAAIFGFSNQRYNYYETGKREPDNETLIKFADYFGVSSDYLLGISDDPMPPDKKKPTPETVGPALVKMLKEHGYLQDDQPLTDEEADEILRITKAVWEARRPPKQ